jgi:hypothetical protein
MTGALSIRTTRTGSTAVELTYARARTDIDEQIWADQQQTLAPVHDDHRRALDPWRMRHGSEFASRNSLKKTQVASPDETAEKIQVRHDST